MSFRDLRQGQPGDHPALGGVKIERIPHAKKPKVRPPRGIRDHAWFPGRRLPPYTGPYSVGTMEMELPARSPRHFSNIKRNGRHVLELETVLMTVYYPSETLVPSKRLSRSQGPPSRELWLGRPRVEIAKGYGKFGSIGSFAVPIFLPTMFTKLPAYRNTNLAKHWAQEVDISSTYDGKTARDEPSTPPIGQPKMPRFPVIMFSHGLGGTRTMYSSVCGEFASYGFVVVAVEHRDGSGPRTYVNYARSGDGSTGDLEQQDHIQHTETQRKDNYDIVDYLFPQGNKYDTSPNNEQGVDMELRGAQIDLRLAEIEEARYVLERLNEGGGEEISAKNLRRKGYKASSSHGLDGIDWNGWKDRLHLQYVTACGHSFGAATVVEILRHDDRFDWISQGIIYDIWGAGTRPPEEDMPDNRIHKPLLAIMSEAFTYWPSNFALVESIINEASVPPQPAPSWLLTLRGTVHVSQSDFSLLYPNICSLLLKQLANPRRALDLNINASLEFLQKMLPPALALVNRAYQNEKLLQRSVTPLERIPSALMAKPEEKYTAMRLKIKHELLYRVSPSTARSLKRREVKRRGIEGSVDDEVWLQMKPRPIDLEEYQEVVKKRWDGGGDLDSFPSDNNEAPKHRATDETESSKKDLDSSIEDNS